MDRARLLTRGRQFILPGDARLKSKTRAKCKLIKVRNAKNAITQGKRARHRSSARESIRREPERADTHSADCRRRWRRRLAASRCARNTNSVRSCWPMPWWRSMRASFQSLQSRRSRAKYPRRPASAPPGRFQPLRPSSPRRCQSSRRPRMPTPTATPASLPATTTRHRWPPPASTMRAFGL